eukprot:6587429-Pyramimonas_sp.AAC.1
MTNYMVPPLREKPDDFITLQVVTSRPERRHYMNLGPVDPNAPCVVTVVGLPHVHDYFIGAGGAHSHPQAGLNIVAHNGAQ